MSRVTPSIVDAHVHLGSCRVFGKDVVVGDVTGPMEKFGIGVSVVQPFPGAPDPVKVHDDIYALGQETGGRVVGLVSLSPHGDAAEYRAEVTRCVTDMGFVGVKLHTWGHAVNPGSPDAATVFETARELGIPVMVHTGLGAPFADPSGMLAPAERFSDVTIILAHAGAGMSTSGAIGVAVRYPNVVLETSWSRTMDIQAMLAAVGPERVLFGTDGADNVGVELAKYDALGLDDDVRAAVLGGNARRVYGLDDNS
jgi:predicted TIM-barrel fold metal-dependent hydrolase